MNTHCFESSGPQQAKSEENQKLKGTSRVLEFATIWAWNDNIFGCNLKESHALDPKQTRYIHCLIWNPKKSGLRKNIRDQKQNDIWLKQMKSLQRQKSMTCGPPCCFSLCADRHWHGDANKPSLMAIRRETSRKRLHENCGMVHKLYECDQRWKNHATKTRNDCEWWHAKKKK